MPHAIICHHCDGLFKDEHVNQGMIEGLWSESMSVDLCDDCRNKLDEWLHPEATEVIKKYISEDVKKKKEVRTS